MRPNAPKRPVTQILICLLVLGICFTTLEAGTLRGKIVDRGDGQPLYGATIVLSDAVVGNVITGIKSDDNGEYVITNISAGWYAVTISYVGFATDRTKTVDISDDDDITLDYSLISAAIDLGGISVTASRASEKILEAPAAVSVVTSEAIENRAALSTVEHIRALPGVDAVSTGLNQSNVVVRGFNNVFSGALLILSDNRIARVPSLRYNAHNFVPTVNSDIERIEVVSGPGSALYGPNSAAGVMHIITKSPFNSQGTTVTVGGGERDLFLGSFRHAGTAGNRVGYKLSGQYYQGNDWESTDTTFEPDKIIIFRPTSDGPDHLGANLATDSVSNVRNFDVEKMAGEGRVDFLLNNNSSLILSGGFNRATSIELTGLGAGQAIDWTYWYTQARFKYKDLFIQGFVNASDAGDTYLLRTGQLIVDQSKLWAAQIQHRYIPNDRWSFTYGVDGLFTRPNTDETINGRNEDDDSINELGAYVQAETKLSDQVKLIGAARVDDNNRIADVQYSPRLALSYQPDENNNFRVTYNRAYATPDNNNLFLDLLQAADAYGTGAAFAPTFGFSPGTDIRVQGVPESGFHWRMGDEGPAFRSPFAPLDPRGLTSSDFIDYNDPIFTAVMWSVGRGAVLSGFSDLLDSLVADPLVPLDQPTATALLGAVNGVAPATVSGVTDTMFVFNPDIAGFEEITGTGVADIERLEPTITQTIEIGYKGLINNRLRFSVDLYRTEKDNFMGPLTVETPNVFLNSTTLGAGLAVPIGTGYATASAGDQAVLDLLDAVAFGGNGNGSPVDELVYMFASGAARIPFGTVTPEEALNGDAVLVTYRNFGKVNFYGADFAFGYHLNRNWDFGGTYSYVSKNFFKKSASQIHDIYLNAPRHKFSLNLRFNESKHGLASEARLRFVDTFRTFGPFVGTEVEWYAIVDLNVALDIASGTRFSLTVQNVFDNKHIEFVGAPELGRLAIARLTRSF